MRRNQMTAMAMIVVVIAGFAVAFFFMPQQTGPAPDEYVYETIDNPLHLDPHIAYDRGSGEIIDQCYETLYTYQWGSGERGGYPLVEPTVPLLAAGPPTITENGTVYTIELRQGITFADGTPFNASAAVWNFKRAMKLYRLIDYTIAEPIKGGLAVVDAISSGPTSPEFIAAFETWDATDAVEATSTYEVTYRLEKAAAYFIPAMTYNVGCMISPTFAEKHASTPGAKYGVDYGEKFTYMYNHTCGTGPYQVVEWKTGEYVHMALNEDYWRADATEAAIAPPPYAGSIREIWRRTNENQSSMNLNLKTGIVDDTYWPTTHADEIYDKVTMGSKDPSIFFRTGGVSFVVMGLSFQMGIMNWSLANGSSVETYAPSHWREFRNMMTYLLDYDACIQAVYEGWAVKAQGPIPIEMHYHNASYWTEHYDLETAVEYWNEAMQDPGFVAIINAIEGDIPLYYKQDSVIREQVSLLVKDCFEDMKQLPQMNTTGLDYEPKFTLIGLPESPNPWIGSGPEPSMWLTGCLSDYSDPDNIVRPFLHSKGFIAQMFGYSNSVMDDLIMQGRTETDAVVRQQIYNQIQELAAYDRPFLWLYSPKEFTVFRAWLKGIGMRYQPMSSYYYIYHVYKDY